MTEDETVGWHHLLNGHDFEQTPGHSEGQGSLACCSPRGWKGLDTTERLNHNRCDPHYLDGLTSHGPPVFPLEVVPVLHFRYPIPSPWNALPGSSAG